MPTTTDPVLDGNGDPVPLAPGETPDAALRVFMAGRVPAPACPHYMYKSEVDAGLTQCERCSIGG